MTQVEPEGFPRLTELIRGEWRNFDDEDGHHNRVYFIQCPSCLITMTIVLTEQAVESFGLEGAEEKIEQTAQEVWRRENDCHHIKFDMEA